MPIIFRQSAFFQTELFNRTNQLYLSTLFSNLAKSYSLISAKGSTGKKFSDKKLSLSVQNQIDMPYHIHILNGLLPALKLLEQHLKQRNLIEKREIVTFLKTLIVGFTFHDINKIVDKELQQAISDDVELLCEKLNVQTFFPEWRDWIDEIKFLALHTENRTTAYSYDLPIREWQFVSEILGSTCHLADTFASASEFTNVFEFYQSISHAKFNGKPINEIWPLSFIEISDNIFSLLSQKLLNTAKAFIQETRKDEILFHLRNGFVFIGKPLEENERNAIIERFCDDDSTFDAVAQTQINSRRGCQFGFIESRKLTPKLLTQIIDAGFRGNSQIQFFEILKDANTPNTEGFKIVVELIDQYKFPFKPVLPDKLKGKKQGEQKYTFVLEQNSWDDLDDSQKNKLILFALQKIKFMKKEALKEWSFEFENLQKNSTKILSPFTNAYSAYTIGAMISTSEMERAGENVETKVSALKNEISIVLSENTQIRGIDELARFANLYLTGNFSRDIEALLIEPMDIPEKNEMCLFTARKSSEGYGSAKAHGIKALGFSNRTVNTLKSTENKISSLFNSEIEIRKSLINDPMGTFNSCVYYDFGEYIINLDSGKLLDILAQAKEFQHDKQQFQIIIDQKKFTYNLYGMNFEKIDENVKGNFYFIQRNLKLIKSTGFRLFTTSVISPYHAHKEMFVFENCMPFVKALGWDRIRIDEVEDRLQELNMFLTLGSKKLTGNVLAYAEDRKAIFSAFQELKEDEKVKARNSFTNFINNHKEFSMSTMNDLATIAIKMARPQSGSSSQETRIIRDALNILKACYKEKRDRETTIGQIVGELRQLAKTYEYFNDSLALPFAEALHDNLFEKEWQRRFPQPGRLRNWINEFGFWYSSQNFEQIKLATIRKAVEAMKAAFQEVKEDSIIAWLKESDSNKNKAIDKYESEYRAVYNKHFTNN